jgi:hypothetical protein
LSSTERRSQAEDIRQVGREIAAELASGATGGGAPSQDLGWLLWEHVTLRGEEWMKDGSGPPMFWSYTTVLALRTDGEIVAFQTKEGRESPNIPLARDVRPAADEELLYPDVTRWGEQPSVEEAEARTIIDTFRVPVEHAEPRGAGLLKALDDVRTARRLPEPLGQVPVQVASPQERKGFWRRVFG